VEDYVFGFSMLTAVLVRWKALDRPGTGRRPTGAPGGAEVGAGGRATSSNEGAVR
jgi:hypothetical protein